MRRLAALVCASALLLPASVSAANGQPAFGPDAAAEPPPAPAPPSEPVPTEPAPATAAPSVGGDVVTLSDGSFVRGTVEEYEPRSHVLVVKSDGTRRRIAWAEVVDVSLQVERDAAKPTPVGSRAPASSPAPTTAPEPSPPPALGPDEVRLHMVVEGPRGETATVFRHTGTAHAYGPGGVATAESAAVVCTNPCGTVVSKSAGTYHVNRAGDGAFLKSRPFALGGRGSDVTVRVRPGNRAAMVMGFTLTTMGAAFAILGPMILGMASTSDDNKRKGMIIGGAMTGAGVGALVIGIPLMVRGRNRVRLVDGRP